MAVAAWFISALVFYVTLYWPSSIDPGQRPVNVPDVLLNDSYDFIVIGAGSAGSVVGGRLTEETGWKVLLLEAGGDETIVTDTPALTQDSWFTQLDWNYTTTRQHGACQDVKGMCIYPRGKVMGGCSVLNGMIYIRGHREVFDRWEAMGNPGWGYEAVLPYFRKSEDMQVEGLQSSPYHATGGPLTVKHANYRSPITPSFIAAAQELGYSHRDLNGEYQTGADFAHYTMRGPSRCSTNKAFLWPARNRTNLHIAQNALVTKLEIDRNTRRVKAVVFSRNGRTFRVSATKEVILSAGAINSPQILMLSGIGPKRHLKQLKIDTILDLPVGENLQDHVGVKIPFKVNDSSAVRTKKMLETTKTILQYSREGKGQLTAGVGIEAMGFFNSKRVNDSILPDITFHFNTYMENPKGDPGFFFFAARSDPESIGSVTLKSADINEKPLIDVNYFRNKRDVDVARSVCSLAFKLAQTKAFSRYSPELYLEWIPLCKHLVNEREKLCDCLTKNYSSTIFHPVGTTRMGPRGDRRSVVDSELRVHGLTNLRVVDASIMPTITNGNTNAPVIMIGEKASDLIKHRWIQN